MNVAVWAEIRRLAEIEKLTGRAISRRLHCSRHTVAAALELDQPPAREATSRASLLDAHRAKIDALLARYPELSAVRIREEIARGPEGYAGSVTLIRRYLRKVRPARGRVYQEVHYEPAQAMQVDWGECGTVQVGSTKRKVSVFVAVLCYSRLMFIEFTLSQRKAEFYRGLVHALNFFGGSPRALIFDNLKAAVVNGSGRAACLHPEFLALCGTYCLQPLACERRDPESKGIVEGAVRYVKHNALAGRAEELQSYEDYLAFAPLWLETVANVRMHETTRERPLDRFQQERSLLRPLPAIPFDTDEIVPAVVNPHARIEFDGNRYSAPPRLVRQPVTIRASRDELRLLHEGRVVAQHVRCYQRGQLIVLPDHRLAALTLRQRSRGNTLEQQFDALGPEARQFHLHLKGRPVKTSVHLRRLLNLAQLYGRTEVLSAIAQALKLATYDAAYVENLLLAERRRRQLPTPTLPAPKRRELIDEIDLEPPDPAVYDRLCRDIEEDPSHPPNKIPIITLRTTPMARRDESAQARLDRELAELKLLEIARCYREVLDEAARKGSSMLEVLATLIGMEQTTRQQRALARRIQQARLPKQKTLAEYDFTFPKKIPKAAVLRLFDCDFIQRQGCAVLIGPTGCGKTHLLNALGYTACERGYATRYVRVVDMLNHLTTAQINGTLGKALKCYTRPTLLLLDELGYLPIDKRGADLLFQVVAARYESGSIVLTTNRVFREWGALFDVDNTLATALIDRLMHHGEAILIRGDSYRMKDKDSDPPSA